MAEALISAHDLASIDRLLTSSTDEGYGDLLPDEVLSTLAELFPDAFVEVSEIDRLRGEVLRRKRFPPGSGDASLPPAAHESRGRSLRATFPMTPPRHAVSVCVSRRHRPFVARDRVLFRLLTPRLEELAVGLSSRREVQRLSPSETRVLTLVAQGASNSEVSDELFVSVATVRKHLEHIYAKLGVGNRTAAVARAFPSRVFPPRAFPPRMAQTGVAR